MAASDNLNDQQFTAPEPTTEAPYSKFAVQPMADIGDRERSRMRALTLKQVVGIGDRGRQAEDLRRSSGAPDPRDLREERRKR
jgi:hypothetical protein